MEKKYLLAIEKKVKEQHPADSVYEWEGDTIIVKDYSRKPFRCLARLG